MIKKTMLLAFLLATLSVHPQKKINPTPEDVALAKKLKDKYEEKEIAITSYIEEINFSYDQNNDKVITDHKNTIEYINLDSRTEIPIYVFYDDQSDINKPKITYRNKKSAGISFKDEYYNNDELFHTDARVKWTTLNFPLKGYKYNFSYTKEYFDIKYFVNTYFDNEYPILKKTIKVNVPDWLDLEIKEMNLEGLSITKEKTTTDGITTFIFSSDNINPVPEDENKPGPTHYRPHLLFLAKSINKDAETKKLLSDTKDLYMWYHSLVLQMNDQPETLKEKTLSIIENCTTDEEKIKAIYYWVQDNIRYIAFEDGIAGFKPEEAQNVYKKKYGDCKGMANLTKQMLKIAGFDARLTWIGTKHIAYDYSLPTIAADNHMICTVLYNGKKYYLDSTEKYNPLDYNAERIQNKQVLIEDGDNYILDRIPNHQSRNNLETFVGDFVVDQEQLKGKITRSYHGESKTHFLYNINNLRTDKREQTLDWYIRSNDKNIIVDDINVTDIEDRDGNLNLSYKINQKNAVSSFENELYIDIDYYKEYKNLGLDKRKLDYVFPYKIMEKTSINLDIPKNYKIKELPQDLSIKNDDFEISFSYKSNGKKITYEKMINFKKAKISADQINSWKEFHKNLKKQYQKQIILSKN